MMLAQYIRWKITQVMYNLEHSAQVQVNSSVLKIWSQGYIAPEVMNGQISDRSDVYSYGIVSIVAIL